MEFRLLGPLEVLRDGSEVALTGQKPRAMLSLLLLNAGQVVAPDLLREELWDGEPPRSALPNLRTYASQLRQAVFAGDRQRLAATGCGYRLRLRDDTVDLWAFERHCRAGDELVARAEHAEALRRYRSALALWRGQPFPGLVAGPTLSAAATAWRDRYAGVVEDCFGLRLALGANAELVADLRRYQAAYPLRERPWRQLMVAQYLIGDPAGALQTYERARAVFGGELGLDPCPELRNLHLAVLRRDPGLVPAGARGRPEVP